MKVNSNVICLITCKRVTFIRQSKMYLIRKEAYYIMFQKNHTTLTRFIDCKSINEVHKFVTEVVLLTNDNCSVQVVFLYIQLKIHTTKLIQNNKIKRPFKVPFFP